MNRQTRESVKLFPSGVEGSAPSSPTNLKFKGENIVGFMGEISENIGWNDCINYLLKNVDKFQSTLDGGAYDYFPNDEIKEILKNLIRPEI